MEISRIKELALASGFKLKDQVNGELDLNAYVYDFAQALEREVLAQTRSVFGQEAVTTNDTETLDSEITQISESMSEKHYFDNGESEELEMLVAKAMKLGELYERQKWQASKWIDVNFLLPPYDTKVLVSFGDDCDPEFDYLTTDADENEFFANYGSDVKHWMDIPKLPHEEQ